MKIMQLSQSFSTNNVQQKQKSSFCSKPMSDTVSFGKNPQQIADIFEKHGFKSKTIFDFADELIEGLASGNVKRYASVNKEAEGYKETILGMPNKNISILNKTDKDGNVKYSLKLESPNGTDEIEINKKNI